MWRECNCYVWKKVGLLELILHLSLTSYSHLEYPVYTYEYPEHPTYILVLLHLFHTYIHSTLTILPLLFFRILHSYITSFSHSLFILHSSYTVFLLSNTYSNHSSVIFHILHSLPSKILSTWKEVTRLRYH